MLAIFRPDTSNSPRRGFMLFRSFTHTLGFYQLLLTVAFMTTTAMLFHHFLTTFQEVALAVTAADEELLAMLDSFVNNGLGWLFAIVGIYTVCTLMLMVQGARRLQEQAQARVRQRASWLVVTITLLSATYHPC